MEADASLRHDGTVALPGACLPGKQFVTKHVVMVLMWACLGVQAAHAAREVRVGIYQNEPKVFLDKAGHPAGFFVDLVQAIADGEGWQLHYVPCTWDLCLQQLARGDLDIMPDVAHTAAREKRFAFGHEVVLSSWSVLYKRAGSSINSILDLDGKKVAVLRNSIQDSAIRERAYLFGITPLFVSADSFAAAFRLLQAGQVDYVLANRFYGALHQDRYGVAETNILIRPSALKFAFPKQADDSLRRTSDRYLQRFKQDKQSIYYQSLQRWLSPLDKQRIPGWAKWLVLAGVLMLVLLATLVALLRRQLRQRSVQIDRERQQHARLSRRDPLTGLPNRLAFLDRLEQAIARTRRQQRELWVLFIDIDRFKQINESVGHQTGDNVLRVAGQRLRDLMADERHIACLGGDEFALLCDHCRSKQEAHDMATQVQAIFNSPFDVNGQSFYLTSSIGISVYPRDGDTAQDLLKNADTALFQAKIGGRGGLALYRAEMSEQAMQRLILETELQLALDRQQFVVYYQPQVDMRRGNVVGMEALVRWEHPEKGLIPPDQFIPVAENTGLIIQLGTWVFRRACEQMVAWREAGIALDHIAINVSPQQLLAENFYATASGIIAFTGCRPEWVDIEITESSILEHTPKQLRLLEKLRNHGFGIAIDDFGTGHSSLSRLKHLPVTTLKIDLSFVRGLPDDTSDKAIVRAILALGGGLGLRVVAEGIEREAQRDYLSREGCQEGQGYLYSPPLAAEEMSRMLSQEH